MNTYVNFNIPIEPEAMAAHGILNQDLADAPGENSPQVLQFLELASKAQYLCGYNAEDFDVPIARNVFGPEAFEGKPVLEAYRLARKSFPGFPQYNLGSIAHRTGVFERIGWDYARNLHDATADTKIVRALIEIMIEQRGTGIDELYRYQLEVLSAAQFSFGKYRETPIVEVVANDMNYIRYLFAQDWFHEKYPEEHMAILQHTKG